MLCIHCIRCLHYCSCILHEIIPANQILNIATGPLWVPWRAKTLPEPISSQTARSIYTALG